MGKNPLEPNKQQSTYNPLTPKDTKSSSSGTGDKSTSGIFEGSGKKSHGVSGSYVDPLTKMGYEISETGVKTAVIPTTQPTSTQAQNKLQHRVKIVTPSQKQSQDTLSNVTLTKTGSVKVGNVTYTGNAYIKQLGMTANKYKQEMRKKLLEQGANKKQLRPGTYSVKTQTGIETLESGDKVIYNRFGEPVAVQSKFFGKTMSLDNYNNLVDKYNISIEKKQKLGEPYFKGGKSVIPVEVKKQGFIESAANVGLKPATWIGNEVTRKLENVLKTITKNEIKFGRTKSEELVNTKIGKILGISTVVVSLALPGMSLSTKAALILNTKNINNLVSESTTNKTKLASFKELAFTLGIGALGGAAFGMGARVSEDAITATGAKVLARVLSSGGSKASIISKNIAGLSLKGLGKGTKFTIETYFKKGMYEQGINVIQSLKEKNLYEASKSAADFTGMMIGYPIGAKVGKKGFEVVTKKYFPSRVEQVGSEKRMPSAIQADILLSKGNIYAYRRGAVQTGGTYEPRLDKYLSGKITEPTAGTFFRFAETKGVKGGEILPDLSMPGFVQPPSYREMFLNNFKNIKVNTFKRLVDAFVKTPVMTDVLSVGKFKTKEIPIELKNKVIKEFATTGKLSKETQKEMLNYNTLISDKVRELSFAEEQEAVFRDALKLKNIEVGFTRNPQGNLIPVIYEKGTLIPRVSNLLRKRIITEQDAKFIERQYNMWKKFKDDYILPKQHSVAHSKSVMNNVEKIIKVYPEFNNYLIRKYGSLDKAVKEIKRGAEIHDLGKTSETSQEFGTQHGVKISNVYKAGLLPKEYKNIKPEVIQAIRNHESIAGTPRGIYSLRYRIFDLFGRYSIEDKILATADRLDLIRYGMKIDQNRLPLNDVLNRLNIRNIGKQMEIIESKKGRKLEEYKKTPNDYLVRTYGKQKYNEQIKYKEKYNPNDYLTNYGYKEKYTPREYKKITYTTKEYNPSNYLTPSYTRPRGYGKVVYKKKKIVIETPKWVQPEGKGKRPSRKEIKGKTGYMTLPTIFESLTGNVGKRAKGRITGFESSRFY
ncbi:MAG: HD domain-containing protein [Candidatus Omnitrophica bacterium]|nr:HD domain-containing protein [Candidatus Omnitrophota bacterium]